MKPSLRLPRAPSTSRPKPPDGPTTPRSSGALLFSAESRKLLTYETVLAPEASLVRNALSNALGDSRVSMWRWKAQVAGKPGGDQAGPNRRVSCSRGTSRSGSLLPSWHAQRSLPPRCSPGYGNTSAQREQCDVGPLVLMIPRWAVGVAPILTQSVSGCRKVLEMPNNEET